MRGRCRKKGRRDNKTDTRVESSMARNIGAGEDGERRSGERIEAARGEKRQEERSSERRERAEELAGNVRHGRER